MKLIKSQLLKDHKGSWIIETDEAFIFTSQKQVSGYLNIKPPYYTDAYWDDPLLLCLIEKDPSPLVVLGAGILSYLPQIRHIYPELKINHVEFDKEIFERSQELVASKDISNKNDHFLNNNAYDLDLSEFKDHNFFIDIYTHEGIHPDSLSESFLASLSAHTQIAAFNVFDTNYPDKGSSTLFFQKLKGYFSDIVFVNRENSNTIFCSNKSYNLKVKINELLKKEIFCKDLKVSVPDNKIDTIEIPQSVLNFSKEDSQKQHITGPFEKINHFFSSLGPFDLIKASRKKS